MDRPRKSLEDVILAEIDRRGSVEWHLAVIVAVGLAAAVVGLARLSGLISP